MEESINKLYSLYDTASPRLCKQAIANFAETILGVLFPELADQDLKDIDSFREYVMENKKFLDTILNCLKADFHQDLDHQAITDHFYAELPQIAEQLKEDARFIADQDPAAFNFEEVVLCYPGFYAIALYRVSHYLYHQGVRLLPRVLCEHAHSKTGIDIHPAAKIGHPFFIDHGTGVVIGETTIIGNRVKIFQGVTLGALSVEKKGKSQKRHPTIEDDCLIYANATILGGKTVIGKGSTIGGNVWITKAVPTNSILQYKLPLEYSPN